MDFIRGKIHSAETEEHIPTALQSGCGAGSSTPAGTSQVVVTATPSPITQATTIALTVQ
jgi:hypothetical protein